MTERDYAAEIRALVDEELEADEIDIPERARVIIEKLRVNDEDLLTGWLHLLAVMTLRDMMRQLLSSQRHRATRQRSRKVFADAAEKFENGAPAEQTVKPWLETKFYVGGAQKNLGIMTKEDLVAAHDTYAGHAKTNALRAAFFTALQKKVKRGTVSDYYTDEKIDQLWLALTTDA